MKQWKETASEHYVTYRELIVPVPDRWEKVKNSDQTGYYIYPYGYENIEDGMIWFVVKQAPDEPDSTLEEKYEGFFKGVCKRAEDIVRVEEQLIAGLPGKKARLFLDTLGGRLEVDVYVLILEETLCYFFFGESVPITDRMVEYAEDYISRIRLTDEAREKLLPEDGRTTGLSGAGERMDDGFRKDGDVIRKLIDSFWQVVGALRKVLADRTDVELAEPGRMKDDFRVELFAYAAYLAASDGKITRVESDLIAYLLDFDLSPMKVKKLVEENNIYSVEFEQSVPRTLINLVEADNVIRRNHLIGDVQASTAVEYVKLFGLIGAVLICADREPTEQADYDYKIYNLMLRSYVADNLEGYQDEEFISN